MLLWLLVVALAALGSATNSSAEGLGESNCRTPDGRDGHCILASQCTSLSNLSATEQGRFVCGNRGRQAELCCPPEPEAVANSTDTVTRQASAGGVLTEPVPVDYPSALPSSCGKGGVIGSTLVKGWLAEADVGGWPWMAAIYRETKTEPRVICNGALVTDRHVLTSANCVSRNAGGRQLPARMLTVRLGDHDLNSTDDHTAPVDVQVSDVVLHPDYAQSTYTNNIALLVLSEAVTWSRFVHPVCLPFGPLASETLEEKYGSIVGWGVGRSGAAGSSVLHEALGPIWTDADCKRAYERYLVISKAQLCAGDIRGETEACQGDIGGALLLLPLPHEDRYYLVGILLAGNSCGSSFYPGVYTRVSAHLDWLRNELVRRSN